MKKLSIAAAAVCILFACSQPESTDNETVISGDFPGFLEYYYDVRAKLNPIEAMGNGDNRYNAELPIDISVSYRTDAKAQFTALLDSLHTYDFGKLNAEDQLSYEVLEWELKRTIERFNYPEHLMPINQFWSFTNTFAQLGSGKSSQPFLTVEDYDNFLSRMHKFPAWCDTAIANMRIGIEQGMVIPKILVERTLPQLADMITDDATKSLFYSPISNMPESFSENDKQRLDSLYRGSIANDIVPAYTRVHDFMKDEYMPACRESIGITEIPGGTEYYNYLIRYYTTTETSSDSIFNLGMSEVNRLYNEMERVKDETGFKGNMKEFFTYLNTDKKFFPFTTAQQVIDSFNNIHEQMKPYITQLFDKTPRTGFEVRQTEKFREKTASAEYNQGKTDGSKPGIFYTPIPDPKKYNTFGMEDLFLHEAIPGHHFQIMLTAENETLPKFRKYIWYNAYGEGWALYTESLGKELGLYKDPYQYFAGLSGEMHRAIRLVVDVGMHAKGWTREQAIQFSLDHEGEGEASITSEIERYIAIPGQALSYKIGQLEIIALRKKAEAELGDKFDIREFHNQVLEDGCLPLELLTRKIDNWITSLK